jgi:phage host-nuclease inhibitor protein Gam
MPPTDRPLPKDDTEVQALLHAIVSNRLDLEQAIAKRDAAVLAVTEEHAPRIDRLRQNEERDVATLERWSVANKDRFGAAKTLVMCGHRFGFRLGNWKTKTAAKHTWEKILTKLRDVVAAAMASSASQAAKNRAAMAVQFIRTKEEPAKDAMLQWREEPEAAALLTECGVRFEQEQAFHITPDRDGQPDLIIKASNA